jgi:hypothetical protein
MYQLNNLINMRLDGVPVPLLREFFGGLGIFYLVFHYFVYRWIISDRVATLANKDGFIVRIVIEFRIYFNIPY